jgi:hypothetical protein
MNGFMKQFFLFLFFFPVIVLAQPKMSDIVWVGKNKEYLHILKKEVEFKKGEHIQEFKVVQYVKNSYIILGNQHITGYFEQRYDIVRFTQDTLILVSVGKDVFRLCQPDENNQYVFTNSLNGFSFTKLHFETSLFDSSLDLDVQITLDIDSTRKSRVKIHDDYMNETNIVTTPMSKIEYKTFIQILAICDLNSISEKTSYFPPEDIKCCNSVFEVQYNGQVKKCKGCTLLPFYDPALEDFLMGYIASKSSQSGRNPRIWY